METGFAKKLADTDQGVRDKAITTLKKWLKLESPKLAYPDYLKLWKGLFFSVWMADKPKYQNELAERLAGLVKHLSSELPEVEEGKEGGEEPEELTGILSPSLLFIRAFWETICREWRGIDRLRLNKYYYLMKQFMAAGSDHLRSADFDREFSCLYFAILAEFPLNMNNDKIPMAIKTHFIENYAESLRSLDEMFDDSLTMILMSPLIEALAVVKDKVLLKTFNDAFSELLTKHQELNAEAMKNIDEKSDAAMTVEEQDVEEEGEDEDENQDVFDFGLFSMTFFGLGADPEVKNANRKVLYGLAESFKPFASEEAEEGDCCDEEGFCCAEGACCDGDSHDHDHEDDEEDEEEGDDTGSDIEVSN